MAVTVGGDSKKKLAHASAYRTRPGLRKAQYPWAGRARTRVPPTAPRVRGRITVGGGLDARARVPDRTRPGVTVGGYLTRPLTARVLAPKKALYLWAQRARVSLTARVRGLL